MEPCVIYLIEEIDSLQAAENYGHPVLQLLVQASCS